MLLKINHNNVHPMKLIKSKSLVKQATSDPTTTKKRWKDVNEENPKNSDRMKRFRKRLRSIKQKITKR